MTHTLLLPILASFASAFLAVALSRNVLQAFIMNIIPDMFDEECRTENPMTKSDAVMLAITTAFTTYVLSTSLGGGITSFGIAAFVAFAMSISFIDLIEHWIPNVIVYPLYAVTALTVAMYWSENNLEPSFLLGALNGGIASWLLYMILWKLTGERLGFGDVRYSAVIGAIVGGFCPAMPVFAIFFANAFGLLFAIFGTLFRARSNDELMAFGPFMTMGAVFAILSRDGILEWWLNTEASLVWLFSGAH